MFGVDMKELAKLAEKELEAAKVRQAETAAVLLEVRDLLRDVRDLLREIRNRE